MSFPYKHVLIFGATSGIGEALAKQLFDVCETIIVTGRREENLKALCEGVPNASYRVHDISDHGSIAPFAASVVADVPQLDCIVLNSGIQRGFDFSKPDTVDLSQVDLEIDTNYVAYLHVLKHFLPHLLKQPQATVIAMSSGLALVPLPRVPNYCATKAALHQFWLSLRVQLQDTSVKVIEVFPPAVQTELHDEKHQPDIKNGRSIGMPLAEFTAEAWAGLLAGEDDIPVGPIVQLNYEKIDKPRQEAMNRFLGMMRKQAGA
ncbi:short-chain dehydrogenase/oxidoreductase [Calocera viscosa TUFC12733]|uniref:Short-chain dehydrogenase/oxidoreductase n=1 Tax=Calocera viscosa (strain TUFC12733) TaxID=1330018 RepID=A0A167HPS3_CALVF|nr:short-chain dehydrogenase/oxidoreductase [Calocera viscosa TUFC12733]